MKSPVKKLSQNLQIDRNVAALLQKRLKHAQEEFAKALREAQSKSAATLPSLLAPDISRRVYTTLEPSGDSTGEDTRSSCCRSRTSRPRAAWAGPLASRPVTAAARARFRTRAAGRQAGFMRQLHVGKPRMVGAGTGAVQRQQVMSCAR